MERWRDVDPAFSVELRCGYLAGIGHVYELWNSTETSAEFVEMWETFVSEQPSNHLTETVPKLTRKSNSCRKWAPLQSEITRSQLNPTPPWGSIRAEPCPTQSNCFSFFNCTPSTIPPTSTSTSVRISQLKYRPWLSNRGRTGGLRMWSSFGAETLKIY